MAALGSDAPRTGTATCWKQTLAWGDGVFGGVVSGAVYGAAQLKLSVLGADRWRKNDRSWS